MPQGKDFFSLLLTELGIEAPYDWQRLAYERFCDSDLPAQIKVPTAAGKTMAIAAFIAALATQAQGGTVTLPRRLVHVVNRRVLVDEAANLAERIQRALDSPALSDMRDALRRLSASAQTLAVSRLRGGVTDGGEWSRDPSTPAIILATPDMLGSRLLFRGYGVGRSRSATHAGLLACDTLIVHDEAHLAPAFTRLLRQIEASAANGATQIGRPPLRVIEMTATLSSGGATRPLVCDVGADAALTARMSASKRLQLIDLSAAASTAGKPGRAIEERIAQLALAERDTGRAVAIFVSAPASAAKIANQLLRQGVAADKIVTLTGTMRGFERAALVETAAFRRFLPGPGRTADGSAYFIATAAGEIGLDIDADLGLFDLSTLDRLIQRAGRINRRGLGEGRICLVHAGGAELPEAIRERGEAALAVLRALPVSAAASMPGPSADASPLALSRLCDLPAYVDAIEPAPATRSIEPAIIELLAMTSLRLDELACPAPDVFIHGIVEDRAEIRLVWRQLPRAGSDFAAWLDAWPVVADEMACLPREEARRLLLTRLLARGEGSGEVLAIALDAQGAPHTREPCLTATMNIGRWINRLPADTTVLLPPSAGGLNSHGIPSADCDDAVADVSAAFTDDGGGQRVEVRVLDVSCQRDDESVEWRCGERLAPTLDALLAGLAGELPIVFHDAPASINGVQWSGSIRLWLARRRLHSADSGELASLARQDRLLDEHLELAGRAARRLCAHLALPEAVAGACIRGAAAHDRGKAAERWQRAIGNADSNRPLGKSARTAFDQRINDGYRHELGSLVDFAAALTPLEQHLVAAHHGWSRPGFRSNALDKPGCRPAAQLATAAFAALGRRLGPWALCYLEAMVKTADALAEVLDASLAAEAPLALPAADSFPVLKPVDQVRFHLAVDVLNFGEYLAALGLAALLDHCGEEIRLAWKHDEFVIAGVDEARIGQLLQLLRSAAVRPDADASVGRAGDESYPPLQLVLGDGSHIALNHWLDQRLLDASGWKLGAGRTSATNILQSVIRSCAQSLSLPDFAPATMFTIGSARIGSDAKRFRFDSATSWSARDVGFSLNENDAFKSTRPWVELLSVLGLQRFFLPPADAARAYHTWRGLLPPTLALVAAKGLLPDSDQGYRPVFEGSGEMKDVFTSEPLFSERKPSCPANLRIL